MLIIFPGVSAGRSPFTWYLQEYADKVPMTDMNMRANVTANFPGRTYRFYKGKTIYEFGRGLSYTSFSKFVILAPSTIPIASTTKTILEPYNPYSNIGEAIDASTLNCNILQFDVVIGVRNKGPMNGDHVVLLFWKPPSSNITGAPNKQLVGFERVEVKKGKTKKVTMSLDVCKDFTLVDAEGKRKLVIGQHTLFVGSTSERQVRHHFIVRQADNMVLY
ncbi:hypothetical protein V6N13_101340 [Hibiscus sabdariffa]